MAASEEPVYTYPDPSMFALNALLPQDSPFKTPIASDRSSIPLLTAPTQPFVIDPVLLDLDRLAGAAVAGVAYPLVPAPTPAPIPVAVPVTIPVAALVVPGPAPAQAPNPGHIPVVRPSAAGLQPLPELVHGLQAPRELRNKKDIALWDKKLEVSLRTDHMGLRVRKDGSHKRDKNDKSQKDRQTRARKKLKELWEKAGGTPYVRNQPYNR